MLVAVLLPFLCCLGSAAAGKVLVIPMEGSHWLSMKEVLIELSKRGHEIIVMAPEMKTIVDSSEWYTLKTYPVPLKEEEMEDLLHSLTANSFNDQPFIYRFLNIWDIFKKSSAVFEVACSSLLHNKEMMKFIEESKFDVMFTDPVTPCGQIIALHFSIPSAFFLRGYPMCYRHSRRSESGPTVLRPTNVLPQYRPYDISSESRERTDCHFRGFHLQNHLFTIRKTGLGLPPKAHHGYRAFKPRVHLAEETGLCL